jgi:serine/threonine protein kinase
VYLARRRAAGVEKWLVVKRMRPERAGDARFLDLFMREARLSMSLAHQNIVPVFDFGRIDDQVFLAMERVEGKDLGSSITKAGKGMPPLLAAFIAAECCQALDYAHRRKGPDGADLGIVHRDVTPRNVLLSWSGEVKLTDFGIAALAGDEPSKMAGTPAYMAPEQARGEGTDVRADVYAVGMVLREALTGERGRRGTDRDTVLALAQAGTLDPWPEGFDSPLKPIVDRATAVAKADRYPDARAMLEDLDAFMVTERAAHKGEGPARQLAAWLAEIWQGETDDVTISNVDIDANAMMSFLDDGHFDVVGTGTQRSMAMTAAEAPEPEPAPRAKSPTAQPVTSSGRVKSPTAQPMTGRAKTPTARPPLAAEQAAEDAAEAEYVEQAAEADMAAAAEPRRSRAPWLLLGALAVAAGGVALGLSMRQPEQPEHLVEPRGSDSRVATMTADAAPKLVEPEAADAIAVAPPPPVDAGSPDAPTRGKQHVGQHVVTTPRPDARVAVVTPPTDAKKYKVVVNAKPWSYFTIDNDPTKYQTMETVMLAPGPHKIHFTGNQHFPADKTIPISVPENDKLTVFEKLEEKDAPAPPESK